MTHASVFSGIGGPEVAATMLGWENLFHCEINPFGKKVLDYWYPNAESYDDITKTDFTKWRGRISVLTGGFPCQPFSYAGQRRGAEDDRYLWPHMFRCIDEIRPDWVVAENVAGILTMVEQGTVSQVASAPTLFDTGDMVRGQFRLTETFTLERICTDLESHGYEVQPILIPACAVGAPHRRDRVFIVGHRKDDATHTDSARAGNNSRPTCDEGRTAGKSGRESLRQGHGKAGASGIEPTSANDAPADTDSRGLSQPEPTRRESEYSQKGARMDNSTQREGKDGDATHPDSHRRREKDKHLQPEQPNGAEPFGNGREWDASATRHHSKDTLRDGCERRHSQIEEHQRHIGNVGAGDIQRICGESERLEYSEGIAGLGRWDNFPTVSPIHRGNDGLPFSLDDLTLSQGKWRTEALKAYGNAIVPQVMYEIFRAIEIAHYGN